MTAIVKSNYTTTEQPRQTPVNLGNYTCMPRACPKCGARETWLSDSYYAGGHGYVKFWHCEHCSHGERAEYSQYAAFYWCFYVPHAGQLAAVLAFLDGATPEAATAKGAEVAAQVDRMAQAALKAVEPRPYTPSVQGLRPTKKAHKCERCGADLPAGDGWYWYMKEDKWYAGADHAYTYEALHVICDECRTK